MLMAATGAATELLVALLTHVHFIHVLTRHSQRAFPHMLPAQRIPLSFAIFSQDPHMWCVPRLLVMPHISWGFDEDPLESLSTHSSDDHPFWGSFTNIGPSSPMSVPFHKNEHPHKTHGSPVSFHVQTLVSEQASLQLTISISETCDTIQSVKHNSAFPTEFCTRQNHLVHFIRTNS